MPFTLGYGTNGFTDHPLDVALDVLAHEGYGAVALTLGFPHLDPFADGWEDEAAALRTRLAAARDGAGIRVVVETGTRFLLDPFRKHRPTLVDTDADARLRFLRRAVEVAAVLDAECVSFFSGVLPDDVAPAEGWSLLRERLPALVEHARDHGVRLSLEPEPGMLVETVGDALRLRDELGETAATSRTSASRSTSGTASSSSPTASWARCARPPCTSRTCSSTTCRARTTSTARSARARSTSRSCSARSPTSGTPASRRSSCRATRTTPRPRAPQHDSAAPRVGRPPPPPPGGAMTETTRPDARTADGPPRASAGSPRRAPPSCRTPRS